MSVYSPEGFEAADDGAIGLEHLDPGAPSLAVTADYLAQAVIIYISGGNLHITVGVGCSKCFEAANDAARSLEDLDRGLTLL